MTLFFIRTDSCSAGPFTGVELREAALAGILSPESQLAATPSGPWVDAMKAGLFSEDRLPLPHPHEVLAPQFHVRGMAGASQGPFKLRELIGFAARGLLPRDSLFLSGPDQPWITIDRLRILLACVAGELTMLNLQGQVVLRASRPATSTLDLTALRTPRIGAMAAAGLLLVATAYAVSYWQQLPVQKQAIVGDWIGGLGEEGGASENAFGLKFHENGRCVFFNPKGSSWSGDYDWVERREAASRQPRLQSLHVIVDNAEPNHVVEEVRASDGYLRLSGIRGSKPKLDGHAVSDLFVRKNGNSVRLGYLTEVTASEPGKRMKAAWVEVTSAKTVVPANGQANLAAAESLKASPVEMLLAFGVPDEARDLYPFEARRENLRDDETDATAIRYGDQRLILRGQRDSQDTQ
jgi:hypothetical protein